MNTGHRTSINTVSDAFTDVGHNRMGQGIFPQRLPIPTLLQAQDKITTPRLTQEFHICKKTALATPSRSR